MSSAERRPGNESRFIRARNFVMRHPIGVAGAAALTGVLFHGFVIMPGEATSEMYARAPHLRQPSSEPRASLIGPREREKAGLLTEVYEERRQQRPWEFPIFISGLVLGTGGMALDAYLAGRRERREVSITR